MGSRNPEIPKINSLGSLANAYANFISKPEFENTRNILQGYVDEQEKEALKAQEQERYNTELGFKTRNEERLIGKDKEDKERLLATNNALALLRDPSKATSLHTPASELTTQNQIDMYNKANSDGVVTPQEQALIDAKYKEDVTRDVFTNPFVDQNTVYTAERDKAKMEADANYRLETLAYQQKQLEATNSQNKWSREQITKQEKKQEDIAKAIILNSLPQNVEVPNGEYNTASSNLNDTQVKIKTLSDLINGQLTPEEITALNNISDKDAILNAAQATRASLNNKDKRDLNLLETYDDGSGTKEHVNQKLLNLLGGNQGLYDKVVKNPTLISNTKALNDYNTKVKQYQDTLAKTPQTITKSVAPSSPEVANKILNDPNVSNVAKLQALTLLGGEDNSLGSLFNTSGSNGKSNSGLGNLSLGGSDNSSSLAKKKYKAELNDKQAVLYQNLKTIEEKNPNIPQNVLVALKEADAMGSPAAVQEVIKTYFNEDYLLKDSLEAKNKLIVKSLQSTIDTKEDTDKDTMKNINAFVNKNQDVIKQLTPTQIETFLEKVKINYPSELGTFDFNYLGKSPIADALSEVVEEHNKNNPNIKWIDLP